jgi:hypothetical protein
MLWVYWGVVTQKQLEVPIVGLLIEKGRKELGFGEDQQRNPDGN